MSHIHSKFNILRSDKNFSEILTGSAFAIGARVLAAGMTLVSSIIISRFYGAEALGVLAVVNSFLLLVTIFTVMGTGTSVLRLIPEHMSKYSVTSAFRVYRKVQYLVTGVSLVTGTIFFFAARLVAEKVFSKPHFSSILSLAAAFVVFKSLMLLNTQAVRGLRLIRTFAVMQALPSLAMLLFILSTTYFFWKPNNPVYSQLAAYSFTAIVGALVMDRAFKNKIHMDDKIHSIALSEILSTSLPMLMTASIQFFISQIGVIILGIFRNECEVGFYSIAVKLATLTAFVLNAVNSMAAPKFSELFHSGKIDDLFCVTKKSTRLIFFSTVPILLFLIVFGKVVLGFAFGEEFTAAYPAMVLLVIGQFVNSISGSTGYFMNMTGQHKIYRNIVFLSALINVAFTLTLIPLFGITGAAFASMMSLTFLNICTLIYIRVKFGRTIAYIPRFFPQARF